jgi:hypothetical protein
MQNIRWLTDNVGDTDPDSRRYPRMPTKGRELAAMLGIRSESGIPQRLNGTRTSNAEVQSFLMNSGLRDVHPEFQALWFDWPPHQFISQMQAISFGRWNGDEPLDGLSSTQPALSYVSVVRGEELAGRIGRGPQRSDLGADIRPHFPMPRGLIEAGSRFGIELSNIEPAMMKAVDLGKTTSLLLFRSVREPYFKAAPCPQAGCLHLLFSDDWSPVRFPLSQRHRLAFVRLIVARKTGEKDHPYGFSVPPMPERIELLLAVFGHLTNPPHEITPLYEWSETGGLGRPAQRECLRDHLAEPVSNGRPRIAGRMLIDVIPPPLR